MPKISVILPNYNHAQYLPQRIESILNQTYQDFELIILDDCSTDNSMEVLSKYASHPKVSHFVVNEQNSGNTFKQWNKGINLSGGEWIWIAESDDWAEKEFLEVVMNKINQTKEKTSFCFTNSTIADADGNKLEIYNKDFPFYQVDSQTSGVVLINKYLHTQNIFPNASAVVFNKELYKTVNHTELQKYKINGDWYLWICLLLKGDCVFIKKALNNFRRHDGASSQHNVRNLKNIEEAMRINLFLKKLGLKYQNKYWIKFWLHQTNYNLKELLSNNFFAIFKIANLLYPFTSLYLIPKLIKIRMSKKNA